MDKNFKRLFTVFFMFKVVCAVMMSLMMIYYWGMSDNFNFFNESRNMINLIREDVSNFKYFFLPVETYNDTIKFDNELIATNSSIGIEANFLMAKIGTLLYPFAFGKYLIMNFLFSMIACIGQLKLYIALSNRYPHSKKGIAIGVLLMPSILLYSSYMNKETLCMAFMGFAVFSYFQIMQKKKVVANTLILLFNVFLIATVKSYVLIAFIAAIVVAYLVKAIAQLLHVSIFLKIFIIAFFAGLLFLFFSNLDYFDSYVVDFASKSNTFQEQYNSQEESSAFEFGEVETSFSGILKKAPLGIYTTYFRPGLWEVSKPIILFNAIESFCVLIFTAFAFFTRRKYIGTLMRKDMFANISFYYVLIFGVIVGLTTFNFGTLVRYKIPAIPFLICFVCLLLNYGKKNVPPVKEKVSL